MNIRRRTPENLSVKPPNLESSELENEEKLSSQVNKRSKAVAKSIWNILKYILLFLIVPPFVNYAALQQEMVALKPAGELYDVGFGRKMFMMCSGKGPPTVILDAPTGMTSDVWTLVWPKISQYSKVCVYDRAGLGFSERPTENISHHTIPGSSFSYLQPFTVESMVDDLHRLITFSNQQPRPLILVGSEIGALVAQMYSIMHNSDVLGLVLLNPLPDSIFDQDHDVWAQYWFGQLIPTYQSLQLGAALGMTRLGLLLHLLKQPLAIDELDPSVMNRQKYLLCYPRHLSSVVDEHHFINETFLQIRNKRHHRTLASNISMTVLTGNYYDEQLPNLLNKAWAIAEQELISNVFPLAQHIVINGADRRMPYTAPHAVAEQESLNFVNKAFDGDVEVESIPAAMPIIRGSTSSRTSNPALADLVGLIIKRTSMDIDGRDAHPFGRDCSIEGILSGSRPQSHSKNSAFGKLVVWITLVCILLGSACGIIFLSETYNASLRQQARVDPLTSNATGSLTK